jgi:Zn-dependent protease
MAFQSAVFLYIIIIFSSIIHEFAHGWAALSLGDQTAQREGRLTLNPLAHIDLFGTVVLPIFLMFTSGIFIGYAKPVPFNPLNLKKPMRDTALVGIAGPSSNLLIAAILGLVVRFFGNYVFLSEIAPFLSFVVVINIYLALFNLIPVPPLDGSKVLLGFFPKQFGKIYAYMEGLGFFSIFIALFLAMLILPNLAPLIFKLIVGKSFFIF